MRPSFSELVVSIKKIIENMEHIHSPVGCVSYVNVPTSQDYLYPLVPQHESTDVTRADGDRGAMWGGVEKNGPRPPTQKAGMNVNETGLPGHRLNTDRDPRLLRSVMSTEVDPRVLQGHRLSTDMNPHQSTEVDHPRLPQSQRSRDCDPRALQAQRSLDGSTGAVQRQRSSDMNSRALQTPRCGTEMETMSSQSLLRDSDVNSNTSKSTLV